MGLEGFGILGPQPFLELGDDTLVGEADLTDLDLAAVVEVKEVLALLLAVFLDGLMIAKFPKIKTGAKASPW